MEDRILSILSKDFQQRDGRVEEDPIDIEIDVTSTEDAVKDKGIVVQDGFLSRLGAGMKDLGRYNAAMKFAAGHIDIDDARF